METFTADDGERLHLRITGEGRSLILLHGWTSSHTIWNPFIGLLQPHCRVFCPDARGHGGHALAAARSPDVRRLARDLNNLLDRYGIEQACAVGHSMGALTLWQFIRDYGCGRLSKLCIIDQSPKLITDETWDNGIYGDFTAARSRELIDDLASDFAEAVLRLTANGLNAKARAGYAGNTLGWQQSRQNLHRLDPAPLLAIWKSLVNTDYRDLLPLIDIPVLLIWGSASNFYTEVTARYMLEKLPQATLLIYEGSDHCPQLQQPSRFVADLLNFVAGKDAT